MPGANRPDLIRSFIARCASDEPAGSLVAAFRDAIARQGIRYFACYTHRTDPLDPPRAAIVVHNYPAPWVRLYSEERLHEIDPVVQHAQRSPLPFFWDTPAFRAQLTPPQRHLLAAASRFGLAHGYTMPIHLSWAPGMLCASCSVVPDAARADAIDYPGLQLMAEYLYIAVSRAHAPWNAAKPVVLSRRERQCLALVARGKDDWAIGRLLHISPVTAHTHIERAKRRLQVATRIQAVVQGLMGRQILFADLADAHDVEQEDPREAAYGRKAARRRAERLASLARSRR